MMTVRDYEEDRGGGLLTGAIDMIMASVSLSMYGQASLVLKGELS